MTRFPRTAVALVAVVIVALSAPAHAASEPPRLQLAADDLVSAVLDRLALAVPVAAAKRASGAAVDDPAREAQAAEAFVLLVEPRGIAADTARDVITAQFEASKFEQRALLAQWQQRPETIPIGEPPNLVTAVRPAIDAATLGLADALVVACRTLDADPRGWSRALDRAASDQRPRWRWQREALAIALAPLKEGPCPPRP